MKLMQKGFAPILILVEILVIMAVAGGVYYFAKFQSVKPQNSLVSQTSQPTINPQPTQTSNETVSWKTYTNTKYGFTFRYPPFWDLETLGGYSPINSSDSIDYGNYFSLNVFKEDLQCESFQGFEKNITVKNGLKQYVDNLWEANKNSIKNLSTIETIKIGGVLGFSFTIQGGTFTQRCGWESLDDYTGKLIIFEHNNVIFQIKAAISSDNKFFLPKPDENNINNLVSTFKFTDSVSKEICELGKEYQNTAVNHVNCTCPEGYKFTIISTSWGSCPKEEMKDCPASVVKCSK